MGADKAPKVQNADQNAGGAKAGGRGINKVLKRTKLCQFLKKNDSCPFGDACAFAHSINEVQESPDLRKTKLCKAFNQGLCNDSECNYAHGEAELRTAGARVNETICVWYEKGSCSNGENCKFAHGKADLRVQEPDDMSCGSTRDTASDTMSASGSDGSARRRSRKTNTEAVEIASTDASSEDEESPMVSPMKVEASCFSVPPPPGLEKIGTPFVPPPPGLEDVRPCVQQIASKDIYRDALKQQMEELSRSSALLAMQVNEVKSKLQELEQTESPSKAKKELPAEPKDEKAKSKAAKHGTRTALKSEAPAFTPSFLPGCSPKSTGFQAFPQEFHPSATAYAEYGTYGTAYQSFGTFYGQSW